MAVARRSHDAFGVCTNEHNECALWAGMGECLKNPTFMHSNCGKACKTCEMTNAQKVALFPEDLHLTHSRTHVLTYSRTHVFTYSRTHALTHSRTHSLTSRHLPGCLAWSQLSCSHHSLNSSHHRPRPPLLTKPRDTHTPVLTLDYRPSTFDPRLSLAHNPRPRPSPSTLALDSYPIACPQVAYAITAIAPCPSIAIRLRVHKSLMPSLQLRPVLALTTRACPCSPLTPVLVLSLPLMNSYRQGGCVLWLQAGRAGTVGHWVSVLRLAAPPVR